MFPEKPLKKANTTRKEAIPTKRKLATLITKPKVKDVTMKMRAETWSKQQSKSKIQTKKPRFVADEDVEQL